MLTQKQTGAASGSTTRTTEGTRSMIDGLMTVIERLAQTRALCGGRGGLCADEVGGRRPAGTVQIKRAISNRDPNQVSHTLPERNSGRDERDSWGRDAEAAPSVSECKK